MFVGKTGANKIFKIHYRTRQAVYNVFTDSDWCDSLLPINTDMSIHQKHLRYLAVEVYKTVVEIYPEFMWTYFLKNPIPFHLRKDNKMFLLLARSVDQQIWNEFTFVPRQSFLIINSERLKEFKFRLKSGGKIHCTCNVCR